MQPEPIRYARICRYVRETPWAVLPATLATITDLLRFRAEGGRLGPEEIRARLGAQDRAENSQARAGGTAVIPMHGVIVRRADMFDEMSGAVSLDKVQARLRDAVADAGVGSIVLHVDSPGGSVDGVPETAALIREAREKKPIVAVADTLAASAAYWIASAADELVVTPSGEVGSIGVFAAHEDMSAMLEAMGLTVTLVSAGKFKVEGNPFEPLGEEARAALQKAVDDFYTMFVGDVAKGRGVKPADVRGGFGEGRTVRAREAVTLGMADRVDTLQATIERLANPRRRPARRAATARRRLSFI